MRYVRLTRNRNRINCSVDWTDSPWAFQDDLLKIRRIQGRSYTGKRWTFPLSMGVIRQLRHEFGERVWIDDALKAWGREELRREQATEGIVKADITRPPSLVRVPKVAPTMAAAMANRPYQQFLPAFAEATGGPHLNGDEQGLGKCIETLAALVESGVEGKGLVIGPRTALAVTWMAEIQRWMSDVDGDVLLQIATVRETQRGTISGTDQDHKQAAIEDFLAEAGKYRYAFLLCNAQMFNTTRSHRCPREKESPPRFCNGDNCPDKKRHKPVLNHRFPLLHSTIWDFALADETHLYLTHSTGKKPSQVGLGLSKLRLRPFNGTPGMRIAMTGTPAKGQPLNLFGTLNWVRPDQYTSKWTWGAHYCKTKANIYTQSGLEILNELDPSHARALDRDLSKIMIRRTSEELYRTNPAWAPPPIRFIDKWVELEPAQETQYNGMLRDAALDLGGRVLTANNHLAQTTRLMQIATAPLKEGERGELVPVSPGPKFAWMVEEVLGGLGITGSSKTDSGDEKVVVVTPYNLFLRHWYMQLLGMGIDAFLLTGSTPDREREVMQKRFLKPGGPRVFCLNTLAGGVSLTLDSASTVVVMGQTWVPDETEQAFKRCHRASRVDHFVRVYFPFVKGTVEESMLTMNEAKREGNWLLLDRRRGIEWSKRFGKGEL